MAPSDLHLVAEDGVVGAHVGMILSQSRQLANIVKTLPYSADPIHVVLTGVSIKAVTAAKDLICTGSCVLDEAMIPEVLQTVGILGIEVSAGSFYFENGAIIIPSLNRPTSAADGDGDVRGGQKNRCVDFIKTEDKSEDAEDSCIEDACHPTPRRLKKPKVAYHDNFGKNSEAEDVSQAEEVAPLMKKKLTKKQKKELKKMIKEKRPTIPLQAAPIEEKIIDVKDCVKMLSQPNGAVPQKKHPLSLGMTPQCELCSKKFREMEDLNKHIKAVHEKRGQYKCNLCSKMFVKKKDIEQQVGSVRPNKTLHECEQCLKRKMFNEERNSAEQPKSESSKKRKYDLKGMNYVCHQCNINFARSSALKAHKMNKHKE